jgi:peptidoglycan/xylan/chitin deacetylase (PgdA/CDA1 family)
MQIFKSIVLSQQRHLPWLDTNRAMLVIVLSAMLSLLGVLMLCSSALSVAAALPVPARAEMPAAAPPATHHAATMAPTQAPTMVPTQRPTATPTQTPRPAAYAGPPLFSGNGHLPEIALTFDDGPNPIYTPQVLAVLQEYGVKATFFDVGYLVDDYPNLARQEYAAGHVVANHSWSHPELTRLSAAGIRWQLTQGSGAIQAATGVRPVFFRPPYGAINATVVGEADAVGVTTVLWNADPRDWALPGVDVIVDRILSQVRNGTIILLHDGGGNRSQTVAALPMIITALEQRGYRFVTVQQLVDDLGQ